MDTDQKYIDGLLEGTPKVIEEIYERFYGDIQAIIRSNNGQVSDAEDIFQETLVVVMTICRRKDFELTGQFQNLLKSVARKLWLKQLRGRSRMQKVILSNWEDEGIAEQDGIAAAIQREEQHVLFRQKFEELSDVCRQLITKFLNKEKPSTFFEDLGYSSAHSAAQQLHKCRKKLRLLIQNDHRFNTIKEWH